MRGRHRKRPLPRRETLSSHGQAMNADIRSTATDTVLRLTMCFRCSSLRAFCRSCTCAAWVWSSVTSCSRIGQLEGMPGSLAIFRACRQVGEAGVRGSGGQGKQRWAQRSGGREQRSAVWAKGWVRGGCDWRAALGKGTDLCVAWLFGGFALLTTLFL